MYLTVFCSPLVADVSTKVPLDGSELSEANVQSDGSSLRCWQYGNLIFEETGLRNRTMKSNTDTIIFEQQGAESKELVLMDIGTATCLFQK
jgi:hypothetical protein